jgi:hypothetical protein
MVCVKIQNLKSRVRVERVERIGRMISDELRMDIINLKREYISKYENTDKRKYLKRINLLDGILEDFYYGINEDEISDCEDDISNYDDDISECDDDISDCGGNNIRGFEIKFIY